MPQVETLTLVAKAFHACCQLPLLNILKPAAIFCILICETVQTVTDNKDAAKELGDYSVEVFLLIVKHLHQTSPADSEITPDLKDDAVQLQETLKNVNRHLRKLKNGWKRKFSWFFAEEDRKTVRKLKGQLDDALSLFGISRTLALGREVSRVHDGVLRIGEDVKQVLDTVKHTGTPSVAPASELCFCGLKPRQYTVRKATQNYGRLFQRCPKSRDCQCNFFKWI